jgi:AmmeMemoRadiSam system protein B
MLTDAFRNATVDPNATGAVKCIVAPHAGYRYCVQTAAYAFKSINPDLYTRVVVLGPSHRIYVTQCTIANAETFETPLGAIPFDNETANRLISDHPALFKRLDARTAEQEHSLEMECPFLKHIFGSRSFSIIPIMIGSISESDLRGVADALRPIVADPHTLLVISSDFCHWGADFDYTYLPAIEGTINAKIEALDREGMEKVATGDVRQFAEFISRTGDTICGEMPIKIAMMAVPAPYTVSWPHYSQSSTVRSPRETSVSYAAGIFRV